MHQKQHNLGFTMVELMITLAIAAILMSLAAPSFQSTIRNNRTVTIANNFQASLSIARSEAIKRSLQVSVRHQGAIASNWDSGWDIFTDINGNGTLDDDGDATLCEAGEDCLLKTVAALTNNYTLRGTNNYANWLAYQPDGLMVIAGGGLPLGSFRLCDDAADTSTSRTIFINSTGRARIGTGTTACP